jgi:hypothetical protein
MIRQLLKGIAIVSLWSVCVLSLSITKTYASTVMISQTGSVVTASDSNPYANGFERLSTNGGSTWTTESSGNRDLMFTIYK